MPVVLGLRSATTRPRRLSDARTPALNPRACPSCHDSAGADAAVARLKDRVRSRCVRDLGLERPVAAALRSDLASALRALERSVLTAPAVAHCPEDREPAVSSGIHVDGDVEGEPDTAL